jgi:hypothetical protein
MARHGLSQAFAFGGSHSPVGESARVAYSAGLDLAMVVGATFALAAAIVTYLTMPPTPRPSAAPAAATPQPVRAPT